MPDMTSLAAAVVPRIGKIIKMASVLLREEKICCKLVHYPLYLS